MGTRTSANVSDATTLQFQFLHNGEPYDAYTVGSVTIHASEADAIADDNIIQTIPSYAITRADTGLYTYVVDILSTEGIYYDKIFITPTDGANEIFFINEFFVEESPPTASICYVTGTILDEQGDPFESVRVYARPTTIPTLLETSSGIVALTYSPQSTITDSNGYFRLQLIRSLLYNVIIKEIGLQDTITVPDDSSVNLFSLLGVTVQASTTPADTNWT